VSIWLKKQRQRHSVPVSRSAFQAAVCAHSAWPARLREREAVQMLALPS
jgi:hypothetical protein